jgi:cation diffusion facilitator CzcD-associated flavoprotein CzcO
MSILRYITETAGAFDVQRRIQVNHRVLDANWASGREKHCLGWLIRR